MNRPSIQPTPRRLARTAGLWYLVLTVFSLFGVMFVNARIIVPGDVMATTANILANNLLYRLGILSELLGQASFIFVGLAFYRLFETVDRRQARALLALVVAAVPVAFLGLLNKFAPLVLLGDAAWLQAFDPVQLQALSLLFIRLAQYSILMVGLFWGLWLLPLGILTFKSGFLPRVLGVLLVVNCAAYVVDTGLVVAAPDLRAAVNPVMTILQIIGEVPLLLWLLIRGAKNPPLQRLA